MVVVVHDDHHSPRANLRDGFGNGCEVGIRFRHKDPILEYAARSIGSDRRFNPNYRHHSNKPNRRKEDR
jgi:hypothetical protein